MVEIEEALLDKATELELYDLIMEKKVKKEEVFKELLEWE